MPLALQMGRHLLEDLLLPGICRGAEQHRACGHAIGHCYFIKWDPTGRDIDAEEAELTAQVVPLGGTVSLP
jgi:hypothetical protein